MNVICPQCRQSNPETARFCMNCRTVLAQPTVLQQATQLAPSALSRPLPRLNDQQIRRRITQCLGGAATQTVRGAFGPRLGGDPNQRELTCFLCDVSGSMEDPFDRKQIKLQAAIDAQLEMFKEKARQDLEDEIAQGKFDEHAACVLPMSRIRGNERKIAAAIESLQIAGGTDINAGLVLCRDEIFDWSRSDVVRRIVLLTDGHGGHPVRTAAELKRRGVVIDVVGIGPNPSAVNEALLREVASVIAGQSLYRFIKDSHTLVQHYTQLAGKTRVA